MVFLLLCSACGVTQAQQKDKALQLLNSWLIRWVLMANWNVPILTRSREKGFRQ